MVRRPSGEQDQGDDGQGRHRGDRPATSFVHPSDLLDRIPHDRAGHAAPAAAALAQLETLDRHDFDARLTHLRDRERVALVRDDDAGLERHDVIAIIPLLTPLPIEVATGLDDVSFGESERIRDRRDEVLVLADIERAGLRASAAG